MDNRNLLAISIKHSKYRWKFGMPCWLWGHRTKDDERRCFGGYTQYPHHAEAYSLKEWQESGYGDICHAMEMGGKLNSYCKAGCLTWLRQSAVEEAR